MPTLQPLRALRRAFDRLLAPDHDPRSSTAPIAPREAASDPIAAAIEFCLAGDWSGGRERLRALASPRTGDPRLWRALGMAHGRLGEWRRAQDALERGQRLAPNAEAAELLAEVRAVRRWERALARRAWDAEAHAQLGVLLMAWERGDEALVHLERAAALKPDWSVAHLYLGLEFHYRGDRDIAESHYLEAARLAPEDEAAPRYLAALRAGVLPGQDEPDASEDPWTATLVRATALQPVGAGAS